MRGETGPQLPKPFKEMVMGSILELFAGKKACRLLVKAEGEVMEKYQRFREK